MFTWFSEYQWVRSRHHHPIIILLIESAIMMKAFRARSSMNSASLSITIPWSDSASISVLIYRRYNTLLCVQAAIFFWGGGGGGDSLATWLATHPACLKSVAKRVCFSDMAFRIYTGWPRKNATTLIVNFKNIVDETELFFYFIW